MSDFVEDPALEALQSVQLRGGLSHESERTLECLRELVAALRKTHTDAKITTRDISVWAHEYQKKVEKPLPDQLFNAHSLGKLLSQHCGSVGLTHIGSYGNRQVYTVSIEEDDDDA